MTTELLERMLFTPDDVAVYDTGIEIAQDELRLPPDELLSLADMGLPHATADDGSPLFDYTDLTNVALERGGGHTVPELARRFLMRFAESPPDTWFESREWLVSVRPPKLARRLEPREMAVAMPDGEAPGVELLEIDVPTTARAPAYTARVRLWGESDEPSAAVCAAYDEVAEPLLAGSVRYQNVAEPLRHDPERAWATGVADCFVVSRVLARRLRALGREARVRKGFLLGLLGSDHAWCEVHEDGRWKWLDPAFAYLASRVDALDFAAACRGSRFNRLLPCLVGDDEPILSLADGSPAPLWYFAAVSARPAGS